MNKAELIDRIASETNLSKADAGRTLDAFIGVVTDSLCKGDVVALVGFGTFDVGNRKQRTGRNPQTGETITIPAAKVPRFRAGKNLKEKVNK
jgi:DNA-binding protein HU-beta